MNSDLYADIYGALTAQLRAGLGFLAPVDEAADSTLEVASLVALLESLGPDGDPEAGSAGSGADADSHVPDDSAHTELLERVAELESELAAERQLRAELEAKLADAEVLQFGDAAVGADQGTRNEENAENSSDKPPEERAPTEQLRVLIRQLRDVELEIGVHTQDLSIGRTGANDLQFKDPSVSRQHALLRQSGDVAEIIDCDSRNGVYVNDSKVSRQQLCHGDRVTIGTQRFVFICR